MNALVAISVAAAAHAGMNKRGRPYAFELLGYDFMVDDDLQVWLIEVKRTPLHTGYADGNHWPSLNTTEDAALILVLAWSLGEKISSDAYCTTLFCPSRHP